MSTHWFNVRAEGDKDEPWTWQWRWVCRTCGPSQTAHAAYLDAEREARRHLNEGDPIRRGLTVHPH